MKNNLEMQYNTFKEIQVQLQDINLSEIPVCLMTKVEIIDDSLTFEIDNNNTDSCFIQNIDSNTDTNKLVLAAKETTIKQKNLQRAARLSNVSADQILKLFEDFTRLSNGFEYDYDITQFNAENVLYDSENGFSYVMLNLHNKSKMQSDIDILKQVCTIFGQYYKPQNLDNQSNIDYLNKMNEFQLTILETIVTTFTYISLAKFTPDEIHEISQTLLDTLDQGNNLSINNSRIIEHLHECVKFKNNENSTHQPQLIL